MPVFKTGAINRSANSPQLLQFLLQCACSAPCRGRLHPRFQLVANVPGYRALVFKTACFNHSHIPPLYEQKQNRKDRVPNIGRESRFMVWATLNFDAGRRRGILNHAAAVALNYFAYNFIWRHKSAVERGRFGCPLGILRTAEGGKSGVSNGWPSAGHPREKDQNYFWRAFSCSSFCLSCSSFCPASPSLPSAVSR